MSDLATHHIMARLMILTFLKDLNFLMDADVAKRVTAVLASKCHTDDVQGLEATSNMNCREN